MKLIPLSFNFWALSALTTVLLVGCGKPAPKVVKPGTTAPELATAVADEPQEDPLARIFMKVDEFASQGATNEAVEAFQEGLNDPTLAEQRQPLFNGLIRFLLFNDQIDAAKARMLDAYRNDGQLAIGGLGLVYSYLMERGGATNAVGWTEEVLSLTTLPDEVRRNMREWNLLAYVSQHDDVKMLAIVDQLVKDAPAGGAIEILSRAIDTLFDQKRLESVEKVVQQMGKVVTSEVGTQNLRLLTRMRLMAAQADWGTLQAELPAAVAKLPDADLSRLLRQVLPLSRGAKDAKVGDAVCALVIDGAADKPQSLIVAGRQWVDNVMQTDPGALPERLEHLQRAKLPIRQVCGLYMRYFYDVIDMPAAVDGMKTLGNRIVPLAEDDETRNALRTMILDASFVREDYDTALGILLKGIAGRDAAWHEMAISKVRAHKALNDKKPRDAVKYFREFMATISASTDEPASDPATGLVHSKEMILGRNAKRIGDILGGMEPPDEASAKKAYGEARDYYKQALAAEKDPEVVKLIEIELAAVP